MFKVRVPADFGKQDLVWTLTRNGRTEKAHGHLLLEYEITADVLSSSRQGTRNLAPESRTNLPPVISIDGPAERVTAVGSPLALTAAATDDGFPKLAARPRPQSRSEPSTPASAPALPSIIQSHPLDRPEMQAIVHASRDGLAVTWVQWRGTGQVHFDPQTSLVKNADGKVATKVTFDQPGTYVIRAYADDGILLATADVTVQVGAADSGKK
jgi:hypothetical protein